MNQPSIKILQLTSIQVEAQPAATITDLLKASHFDTLLETHPAQTLTCRLPLDIDHTPAENRLFFGNSSRHFRSDYHFPSTHLAALPHSRLIGEEYILLSGRNQIIEESYSGDHILQQGGRFLRQQLKIDLGEGQQTVPFVLFREQGPPREIDRSCLLPTHYWHFNYHHWLIECLPRLRAALETPELADCAVIMPASLSRFQQDILALLGIPPERLLPFDGSDWRTEQLYFPSIGTFAPHELRWGRQQLLAAAPINPGRPATRRLYISRADAVTRRVINEAEVVAYLTGQGFEIITLTGMPLQQQIALFAEAEVIIGPHGAGLTNILFAPREATLIELMPNDQVNHCFWLMTNALGQDYTFIAGPGVNEQRDFSISLPRLRQVVATLLSSYP